jgi:hypothetical protein
MYYWLGPVVALGVVGLLMLVLRWAYGGTRVVGPRPDGPSDDYGLLQEVAVAESTQAANVLRAVLSDARIRSTMSADPGGRVRVMVFAGDLERARRLVGPGAGG